MRRKINNIISVLFTAIRIIFLKLIHGKSFESSMVERISPNVVLEFNHGSQVTFGNKIRIHSGSKIKVRGKGRLTIGKNVRINYNCIVVCRKEIVIGEGTQFGPSVYLYDHDHDYRVGLEKDQFKEAPIVIGKDCWIGANTVILRGTTLGDHCVVGAGCVLKGDYSDGSIIIQERNTTVKSYS